MIIQLIIVLLGLWFIYDRLIDGRKLPPGPFRLPLLGTIIQMGKKAKKTPAPHLLLKEFSKEYGPIMTLQYGMLRQIVINDPEIIKQIFHSDMWLDRHVDKWLMERSFNKPLGILFGVGEAWRELRRFSIRTLRDFGFGKQKGQEAVMEEELDELFRRLDERLENGGDSAIAMNQFFNISVLNILWSMMAGTRFSHDDEQLLSLVRDLNENMRFLNAAGNILMAFPFMRGILRKLTGVGEARRQLIIREHATFQGLLNERRALGLYKEDQRDFVDVFLVEIDKHRGDNSITNVYTDEQFSTVVIDLFGAGSETTANTLEFALLYMILNPNVQDKVRAEIDKEIGREAFPTIEFRSKMPFTEATILEVQRIASVAPMVARAPVKDEMIMGYEIKKGTATLLNLYSVHMNPTIWDKPEEFRPTRFLNEKNEIVNTEYLLPFGLGKRMCMGDQLARATLFTYFVRFLQNYTIERSPYHPKPVTEVVPGLTLAPKPYHAVIKKRKF